MLKFGNTGETAKLHDEVIERLSLNDADHEGKVDKLKSG